MSATSGGGRPALLARVLEDRAVRMRFWAKVQPSGECFLWIGAKNDGGYGIFTIDRKPLLATRVALTIQLGRAPIAEAIHSCDTPGCVRHLREGTQAENNRDMVDRGRQVRGPRHGKSPEAKARSEEIAAAYRRGEGSARELAKRFGVTAPTVYRAIGKHSDVEAAR